MSFDTFQIKVRNFKAFILTYVVGTQKNQWDGSFEQSKHMFKLVGKKIIRN